MGRQAGSRGCKLRGRPSRKDSALPSQAVRPCSRAVTSPLEAEASVLSTKAGHDEPPGPGEHQVWAGALHLLGGGGGYHSEPAQPWLLSWVHTQVGV